MTTGVRRLVSSLAAFVTMVLGSAFGAAPAQAGAGIAPFFVIYGSGTSTTVPLTGTVRIPFGVTAWTSASNVKLTMDTTGISAKVKLVGVSSPCTRSGAVATCTFGSVGKGTHTAYATFQAVPGASPGEAGTVKLKVSSTPASGYPNATGRVSVASGDVADMRIVADRPTGKLGGLVTVTTTVRNYGPSTQPWVELSAYRMPPGLSYASGQGCAKAGTAYVCRIENLPAGASVTVKLTMRIDKCVKAYIQGYETAGASVGTALQDPNNYNSSYDLRVKISGCAGTSMTGPGSNPATVTRSAAPTSAAAPSPTASTQPSAPPSVEPFPTDKPAAPSPVPVAAKNTPTTGLLLVCGIAALAVLMLTRFVVRRRSRTAKTVTDQTSL